MKVLKQNRGYSLIEVVAAIVIIGIILISFSQIFIQTNKLAHKNNDKLVTIQLADAMLARVRAMSFTYNSQITNPNDYFIDTKETDAAKKNPPTLINLNGKKYSVSYSAAQNSQRANIGTFSEKELKLVKVVVTVTAPDGKTKGSSEGYVALE